MDKLDDPSSQIKYNISDKEIPRLKLAFFNTLKLGDIDATGVERRTSLVRNFMDWIEISKHDTLKISEFEEDNSIDNPDERDSEWQQKNSQKIVEIIKGLEARKKRKGERKDPLKRLEEALQKFSHEDLDVNVINNMPHSDIKTAHKFCNDIERENKELKTYFYDLMKERKELPRAKNTSKK